MCWLLRTSFNGSNVDPERSNLWLPGLKLVALEAVRYSSVACLTSLMDSKANLSRIKIHGNEGSAGAMQAT